jgi:hypothetical protein
MPEENSLYQMARLWNEAHSVHEKDVMYYIEWPDDTL